MMSIRKTIPILIALVCAIASLAGCTRQEVPQPPHTVLVYGGLSNGPVPDLTKLSGLKAGEVTPTLEIIVPDGAPYHVTAEFPPIKKGLSSTNKKRAIAKAQDKMYTTILQSFPKTAHADWMAGLEMASRTLKDQGSSTLYLVGPMLPDTGALDLTAAPLSSLDIQTTVDQLEKAHQIPDLSKISVQVFFCGDTAPNSPQKPLSDYDKDKLKTLWKAILTKGGASDVTFSSALPLSQTFKDLPPVDPVPVSESQEAASYENTDVSTFDEETIAFQKGSAQLSDPAAAKQAVQGVADYMKQTSEPALLVGCAAHCGKENATISLCYERSQVFKTLLTSSGVDPALIRCVGAGWLSPFYADDQGPNGLNEAIAATNRKTVWVKANSSKAQEVLNSPNAAKFLMD